ncbi:DUF5658 family protein [Pyrobaculum islandicum]|uniref:DUF5658 family protein n=1 Tax=Pyrobaculum islandicum TaxID=2277 RepID=UPI00069E8BAC|nr:DUF5658 family protein [Pyrobaculum islandicum]
MWRIKTMAYVFAASAALDVLTTAVGLTMGFVELNPLFAGAPWLGIAFNVVLVVALVHIAERYIH